MSGSMPSSRRRSITAAATPPWNSARRLDTVSPTSSGCSARVVSTNWRMLQLSTLWVMSLDEKRHTCSCALNPPSRHASMASPASGTPPGTSPPAAGVAVSSRMGSTLHCWPSTYVRTMPSTQSKTAVTKDHWSGRRRPPCAPPAPVMPEPKLLPRPTRPSGEIHRSASDSLYVAVEKRGWSVPGAGSWSSFTSMLMVYWLRREPPQFPPSNEGSSLRKSTHVPKTLRYDLPSSSGS
mmetsp:Transcript_20045/g.67945  ORF Transcript_20045/g.67945 Transcript_20045/m.67945 type:complete len:237 (-) Transcript_20045:298-1008(-)